MDTFWKELVWQQFGAAIDTLGDALRACPDNLWTAQVDYAGFWYISYHALFWLDLYLSGTVEGFAPPAPFTLDELDPAGIIPAKPYTKSELLTYLDHCRQKCHTTLEAMTDERANQPFKFGWGEMPFAELLLYNMRHVQEHAAQLNLIIGREGSSAPGWVSRVRKA